MKELMIDDRLIDKIHGVSKIIDVDHDGGILFHKEGSYFVFRRTLTDVQLMETVPPEGRFKYFCRAVVIGACMVILCTLIVIISSNVVICSQGEAQTITERLQCLNF